MRQPRRGSQSGVQQDAIDDETEEQRFDHFQSGHDEREDKESPDGVAMRSEPAQIGAEIFAAPPAPLSAGGNGSVSARRGVALLCLLVFGIVQVPLLIIADKPLETIARRTGVNGLLF